MQLIPNESVNQNTQSKRVMEAIVIQAQGGVEWVSTEPHAARPGEDTVEERMSLVSDLRLDKAAFVVVWRTRRALAP
jgi:hypothetical protein